MDLLADYSDSECDEGDPLNPQQVQQNKNSSPAVHILPPPDFDGDSDIRFVDLDPGSPRHAMHGDTSPQVKTPSVIKHVLHRNDGSLFPLDLCSLTSGPVASTSGKRPLVKAQGMQSQQGSPKTAKASHNQIAPHKVQTGAKMALLPPQLRGRSNIVTEDVERLNVNKAPGKPSAEKDTTPP